ncbi:MAG TPA: hypothetical protein PKU77_00785 [Ferruginibacter sp.]|nr:hypothetical protein [Ferruginibacter sp.]
MKKISEEKNYLERYRIEKGQYLVGVFEPTITFYKQQVRTTNIFYALLKEKEIKKGDKIAVLGGGIAGLTFASLAIKCGILVHHYEQNSNFLHMQLGCDSRIIHPNVFDWPIAELQSNSNLPVLSWDYGTADHVCRQVLAEFNKLKLQHVTYYDERLRSTIVSISNSGNTNAVTYTQPFNSHQKSQQVEFYKTVIVATGYGVEKGVPGGATTSYWRNDKLSQSVLTADNIIPISGTGDGAFSDLFRATIVNSNILELYKILSEDKIYSKTLPKLEKIREEWKDKSVQRKPEWLYKKLKSIIPVEDSMRIAQKFEFNKATVTLFGLQSNFSQVLNLDKMSFINAFLGFILFESNSFVYQQGEYKLDKKKQGYKLKGQKASNLFIARHGTELTEQLKQFFTVSQWEPLEKKQQEFKNEPMKRLWDNSYLEKNYVTPKVTPVYRNQVSNMLSFFTTTLANAIKASGDLNSDSDFRLALHNVIFIEGKYYFQQMTSYAGSKLPTNRGGIGRVYPIDLGNVGLSIRTNKAILIQNKNKEQFNAIMNDLNINPSSLQRKAMYLSVPILSKDEFGSPTTNLILYLDSKEHLIDKNPNLINLIYFSIEGLVNNMEMLIKNEDIDMSVNSFVALKPKSAQPFFEEYKHNSCLKAYELVSPLFEKFYSFDLKSNIK